MKVLHVIKVRGVGGAEQHLLALLPALRTRGIDARVLSLDAGGDSTLFHAALEERMVPWRNIRCGLDISPRLAAGVIRAVRVEQPDLIHTHMVHADIYGSLAAHALRLPFVSSRHNDDRYLLGPFCYLNRAFMHGVRGLLVPSDAVADFLVCLGLPRSKIATIPYGLDCGPARPSELTPRAAGVADGVPLMLAMGRLTAQKDHATLLRAFTRVRKTQCSAQLAILGTGPLEKATRKQAIELGIGEALVIPGRVEPRDWLLRADVFVHSSLWEGFGIVLLEAMLAGLPVVATRASGVPEIVVDNSTGYLVEVGDDAKMATAISALLDNDRRRAAFGLAGVKRAQALFSVARMTDATVGLYEKAVV